ncbi:MAG: hypothetical protein K2O39_03775 [Clostridiales bacterium]|nr:hypothetical protein [Clostridiales bacterium]
MKIIARKREEPAHVNYIGIFTGGLIILADIIMIIISFSFGWFTYDVLFDIFLAGFLIVMGGMGVGWIMYCILTKKIQNRLPDYLIVYDNDEFIFADGYRCKPTDIVDVICNKAHNYAENPYLRKSYEFGSITVKTKDRTISYSSVETVEVAYTLIYECIKEYKLKQDK